MSLIKICGLSTQDTLNAALDAGADMVGFVFFEKSPRDISIPLAGALGRLVGKRAKKVALTVNAADDELDVIALSLRPDFLQLHGSETPERVAAIKERYGLPVLKALGISGHDDLAATTAYAGVADWLLLDAKPPKDSVLPGGNGLPFDWTLLAHLDRSLPFMLSGGLDPVNVGEAIALARPDAVDVSSGVEDLPGMKNPDKIRAFVSAARAAFEKAL
jgi:phosphoribosylanthranilate isomerase